MIGRALRPHRAGLIDSQSRWYAPAAILFTVFIGACSPSVPELPPLGSHAVILAFGNSLTHGTGARPTDSYPAVLARITGRKVVNGGVPGEISADGLRRLPGVLEREKPALVVICHGGNDLLRKLDREQTERNLRQMIALARERDVSVVLLGVPAPGIFLNAAAFYEDVASDLHVPLEADVVPRVLGDNGLKSDVIHPNGTGYRQIAEAVAALLQRAGAL